MTRLHTTCLILFSVLAFAKAEAARILVSVFDEHGQETPARAWVEQGGRHHFQPADSTNATVYARDESFSFDGRFEMELSPGAVVLHVEKGKEYEPVMIPLTLTANEKRRKSVNLRRWIDMPALGWYSADLHVHLGQNDPRVLKQLALADDVHLVPAFTYWLRGRGAWLPKWPSEGITQPIIIDDRHVITRNNIEIERIDRRAVPGGSLGATFLFNLAKPVTAPVHGEHFPLDTDLCRGALTHSPDVVIDSDKPSWAETVINAALGNLHTVQVCHNHYSRRKTLDGGWGMIGPLASGESNAAANDGLFHRTDDLYYRLLNCGFRLGVSGGSAIGVMPMPTGHHRVYARIDGEFTAEKMWQSIKAGKSFATTGPMLFLMMDGKRPGASIDRSSKPVTPLKLSAKVRSIDSLEALEIIHNGKIHKRVDLSALGAPMNQTFTTTLLPERSGWVAARALYRATDGRLRQAHTSPVYLEIDGQPIAFAEDAQYMLRWIDVLERIARSGSSRFPDVKNRDEVLRTYGEARRRYGEIVETAKRVWGD